MTISAKMVCDSVSPENIRLSTLQLRYPKFIHGEFMTHRVFSRNASSSRAIPVERMIKDVLDDPAMPVFWGKNRPGMQAIEELIGEERQTSIEAWIKARDEAVEHARRLVALGVHKQIVNRIIEPWCHINVVVTATEWTNFFALRRHATAQPEMRALADAVHAAMAGSVPTLLKPGQWHLPYVTSEELDILGGFTGGEPDQDDWSSFVKLSVARCARVSYLTHEGKPPDVEEDLRLYERLVGSVPLHASPAEHQATPDEWLLKATFDGPRPNEMTHGWLTPHLHGNLRGWCQFRKTLPNENVTA